MFGLCCLSLYRYLCVLVLTKSTSMIIVSLNVVMIYEAYIMHVARICSLRTCSMKDNICCYCEV